MKKLITLIIVVSLALGLSAQFAFATESNQFKDVKSSDYFCESVNWAVENKITTGTDATHFSPNSTCTKAELITFLYRTVGSPETTTNAETIYYNDMKDDWYQKPISWAYSNDIAEGVEPHTFGVSRKITRAEFVTYLWKAAGKPANSVEENPFKDVSGTSEYKDAVLWAYENGVTGGTSATTFSPKDYVNRAQVVTFLYRYVINTKYSGSITVTSFDEMLKALATYKTVTLAAESGKEDTAVVKASADVTIDKGQTLIVDIPLYFGGNYKMINNGTITNNINYVKWVTLDVAAKKTDANGRRLEEQIEMITHSDLYVSGSNKGFTELSEQQLKDGSFYVYDGFRKVGGYFAMFLFNGNSYFENNGVMNNNSAFSVEEKATAVNNGTFNSARSFEVFTQFTNNGTFNNTGTIVPYAGATFINNGTLVNDFKINLYGESGKSTKLINNTGATFINNARFNIGKAEFVNSGVFTDNGRVNEE